MRKLLVFLMLAALLASGFAGMPAAAEDKKVLKIEGGDYGYPSPFTFYSRGPGYIRMSLIFDTLTWKDDEEIIPWLAKSWKSENGGTKWTLYLEDDVRWHDGEPLTADDVKFTYEYIKDHSGTPLFKWFSVLNYMDHVEAPNDRTVVVTLTDPLPSFLTDFAGCIPIIPEHIWKDVSDPTRFTDPEAVIGSGPFKLAEYNKAEGYYLYEANEDYFKGVPLVDELILLEVGDPALALSAGEIDEASFWGSEIDAVETFEADPNFEVISGPSFWVLKTIFNCEKYPTNIPDFRRAIAYGIDRGEIIDQVVHGGAIVANTGILHPDSSWYMPGLPDYAKNDAVANQLLDDLGFIDTDGDGIREYPSGEDLEFELLTGDRFAREAELIQEQLESIGIKTTVKAMSTKTLDAILKEGNFYIAVSGHGGIANPNLLETPNWPGDTYHNDTYDSIFLEQETEMNHAKRKDLVNQLQETIANDLPVYTLYHPLMWSVYNPDKLDRWFYTLDGVATGIPIEMNKLIFFARFGDANEDGDIDMRDVTKIARMICWLDPETDAADANRDDKLNVLDIIYTELIILGRV